MKLLLLKIRLSLLCTACAFMISCSNNSAQTTDTHLSLKELHEDFTELTTKIEKEVPNAFYACVRSDYELAKKKTYEQLRDSMTSEELYKVLYPLIQCLNDAHFSINLPDDIMDNDKISFFPIKIIIHENRLFVLEDLSSEPQIKTGEEILFINKIPSTEIITKIKGTNDQNKSQQLFFEYRNEMVFHRRLYALFGFTGDFEIQTASNTYFTKGTKAEKLKVTPKQDYEFKMLNTEIAYLKIHRLVMHQDSLKKALEKDFGLLKKQSVKKLIIDIRGNLGGNSALAKNILDYFIHTPYTLVTGVDYFHKGKHYHSDTKENMHIPQVTGNKFDGKVILISNVLTYSSAHMMQVGFKFYNLGITIGNESSESLYITGEIKQTSLKNSKIEVTFPTVNFELPGYSADKKEYYRPQYTVTPTLEDRLNDNDVLLNKALDILK